jgi:hypothetical protein
MSIKDRAYLLVWHKSHNDPRIKDVLTHITHFARRSFVSLSLFFLHRSDQISEINEISGISKRYLALEPNDG